MEFWLKEIQKVGSIELMIKQGLDILSEINIKVQ